MVHPIRSSFGIIFLLVVSAGAQCPSRLWMQQPMAPEPILSPAPTRDEIIRVVNHNTDRVHTLSTNSASLDGPGFPSLRASLFVERPGRFRISAAHMVGKELDLGSNEELFWMWVRRSQPPAMYFCRHERFAGSRMQQMIPLRPEQVVEAFGLIRFDSFGSHEGPFQSGPGRLQMRSVIDGPTGPLTRVVVIDAKMGWPLEQHLYDQTGKHLATVRTSQQRLDPLTRAYLPHRIEMQWPEAQLSFTVVVSHYRVNQPMQASVWTKPEEPGFPNVDLAAHGALDPTAVREGQSVGPKVRMPRAAAPRTVETTINRQQAAVRHMPIPAPVASDGPQAFSSGVVNERGIRPLPRY